MARPKKSPSKPSTASSKEPAETEDRPASLTDAVQDAVILDDSDQVETPGSAVEDSPAARDAGDSVDTDTDSANVETPEADAPSLEPADEPKPELAKDRVISSPAKPQPQSGGSGFVPMLIGGACAAIIGFGAAQYSSGSWPFADNNADTDALAGQVQTLTDGLAALEGQLGEAASDRSQIDAIRAGQDDAQQAVSSLTQTLAEFDQRLTDLENRPIPDLGANRDAVTAYQEQLAGMRAMFEEELKRIEAAQSRSVEQEQTAAERAEAAMLRSAVAQLEAALDTGAPYADVLDSLSGGGVEIPAGLADHAATGVPTLAQLQRNYPEVARAALNASIQSQADAGQMDGFTAFLRTQLGTRSLEPKEGTDPDAILSRAEAALRDGNLPRAISELEALPDVGRQQMADWIANAQIRQDAVAAAASLSDTLNN